MAHGFDRPIHDGIVHGIKHAGVTINVPKDGPGGAIYVPGSSSDFSALGLTVPTSLWLCQEASGSLLDSIGGNSLPVVGSGHLYQQAVSGWTRKAATNTDGSVGQRWDNTTSVPDPSATSMLGISYWRSPAAIPAGTRRLAAFGVATQYINTVLVTSGNYRITVAGVTTTSAGTICDNTVHPLVWLYDRTNSRAMLYTEAVKLTGTYSAALTGKRYALGSDSGATCDQGWLWSCLYSGSAAELNDAQIKTLLQTLGWTITWS